MQEWLLLGALFLTVTGISMAVLRWRERRRERMQARMQETSILDEGDSTPNLLLGELTPALAEQIPLSEYDRSQLARDLRDAGFYSKTALTEYVALRTAFLLAPIILTGLIAMLVERRYIPYVVLVGLIVGVLGFSLPRIYLHLRSRKRRRQIERGLPLAVDLLTLGLTGGQTVMTALDRVSRELRFSYPVLADELDIVQRQARLTNLRHALQQLGERVRIPEVRNLVTILTQTERLGADVAAGLIEFANTYRTTLRQRADAQANRMSILMVFPTILGLWIPAAVILSAPVIFELRHRHEIGQEAIQGRARQREAAMQRSQAGGNTTPNAGERVARALE
jgi:tight adherence protein C